MSAILVESFVDNSGSLTMSDPVSDLVLSVLIVSELVIGCSKGSPEGPGLERFLLLSSDDPDMKLSLEFSSDSDEL